MEPYTIELQRSQHCANTLVLARKLSEALEGFIHAETDIQLDPLSIGDGLARAMSLAEEKVLKPYILVQQQHALKEAIRLDQAIDNGATSLLYRGHQIVVADEYGLYKLSVMGKEELCIPDAMSIIDVHLSQESESVQW